MKAISDLRFELALVRTRNSTRPTIRNGPLAGTAEDTQRLLDTMDELLDEVERLRGSTQT